MKYIFIGTLIAICLGCSKDGQSPTGKSSNFQIVTLGADTIRAERFVYLRGSLSTDVPSSTKIISRGMVWDTVPGPTIAKNGVYNVFNPFTNTGTVDGGIGRFLVVTNDLYPKRKYYVRAYYQIFPDMPIYGNEISFTVPVIRAYGTIQSITPSRTSAVIKATVYWNGEGTIQYQGLEYYKSGAISTILSPNAAGSPDYTVTLSSLIPNTTYFYRTYVVNEAGPGYSDDFGNFTTLP